MQRLVMRLVKPCLQYRTLARRSIPLHTRTGNNVQVAELGYGGVCTHPITLTLSQFFAFSYVVRNMHSVCMHVCM